MEKKIIRAADYLPKPNNDSDGQDFVLPTSDQLLLTLFGEMPNYNNQKYEDIWQEVFNAEDADGISYCLEHGVDVMNDGEPVPGWRDIVVMLKAVEQGLIKMESKHE